MSPTISPAYHGGDLAAVTSFIGYTSCARAGFAMATTSDKTILINLPLGRITGRYLVGWRLSHQNFGAV